ncbi:MFS transporter [Segnochrobactrum spirostomi]|nr:MFS transporter [Segnochrobactrum spirostomi]
MVSSLRPILSLLLGAAFILAGNGLQFTLLPLRGEAEGFSAIALGLLGSAYYVGFVAGCLLGPYLVLRAGHIRAFAAMVSIASAVVLGYTMTVDPVLWSILRAITGFCLAGLYLIIESWLNDSATNQNRGLVMSAYIVVNFATITIGQMLVTLNPVKSFASFALASMLASVAVVPVALTRSAQPAPIALIRFSPKRLYRSAPVGLVGAFMIGVANGAFWSLGPLFATGSGLGVDDAAMFMSTAVIAGALAQWPVGRLSDSFDRRKVLAVLLVGAAFSGIALWLTPLSPTTLAVLAFVFGALTLPGYSLAAAHAYDNTPRGGYVETAAGILLSNGLGSVFGPSLASLLVIRLGPGALFLFTAITQVVLLAFILWRVSVRSPRPSAEKSGFDLSATAPVGGAITPNPLDTLDPLVHVPNTPPAPPRPPASPPSSPSSGTAPAANEDPTETAKGAA